MRRISALVAGIVITCCVIAIPGFERRAYAAHCQGVTVLVDFAAWGGAVERGCAPNPANGLEALHQAGFSTAGTTRWGDAFVCRINDEPGNPPEACVNTPPSNAYWAYYEAHPNDTSWTYSDHGATATRPTAGMIEAWAFGAGALPRVAPAQANPADPPPTPPTQPTSAPPVAQGAPSGGHAGTSSPGVATATGSTATAPTGATTSTAPTSAGTSVPAGRGSTTTVATAPLIENVSAAALPKSSGGGSGGGGGGSPLGVVLAIVLLVAAGVGGTFLARARRRQRAA
jgi:hypothetical protein